MVEKEQRFEKKITLSYISLCKNRLSIYLDVKIDSHLLNIQSVQSNS